MRTFRLLPVPALVMALSGAIAGPPAALAQGTQAAPTAAVATPAASTATSSSTAQPPAPRLSLGEHLNAGIDALYRTVGRYLRPQDDQPLGVHLNRGIDAFYAKAVPAAIQTAGELGLDGPVLKMSRALPQEKATLPATPRMTLLHAWQAARSNDPTLRAARAARSAAQERLPQARAQMLPQVQLSASRFANDLQRDGLNSLNQPLQTFDRYNSSNDTLSLRQPLFRAQQALGVRQANLAIEEASAVLEREQQDASVRVVLAYFEALLAQDTLQMIESQARFLESALESARRSLVAGVGTRTDIDAAQSRLDLNRAQALEARQQVEFSRRQLQAYVNQPFGELAPLDPQQLRKMDAPAETLIDWVARAESGSPEIKRLMAQRQNLSTEFDKARAGHLPTLDFVAQTQRSRSENTLSPQSRYQNHAVGVQLNVPLYNGGAVNSQTRQVAAEIERVDELLQALKLDLGVRVHREYRSVSEGLLRIAALEQAVRSADVAADSARKSVQAGVRTVVDVLNAEQQAMQARRDLAQARYAMLTAQVRLQALAGQTDELMVARLSALLAP